MVYSYYPGCTLKAKAKKLDRYARDCAQIFEIELEEIKDWQCCGGVYPGMADELATRLSPVRALREAGDKKQDLVTVCSACHHVIKRVNEDVKTSGEIRRKINAYLEPENGYEGETKVIHYLELLRDRIGFDRIREKVKQPLNGKKIAPYYGCLLLRPFEVMNFDDPENPSVMEEFLLAIGAKPVHYALKNECCGGYVTVEDEEFASKKSSSIMEAAMDRGAEGMITACPLCKYNLENGGLKKGIPVYYFTELFAEALGVKEQEEGT
jgi:heterodisulfide reductase subunit B